MGRRGRPVSNVLQKLDRQVGELLLRIVRDGREVVTEDGTTTTKAASAADLKAAMDYLRLHGFAGGQEDRGTVADRLERIRARMTPEQREQADAEKARQRQAKARIEANSNLVQQDNIDRQNAPLPFRPPGEASGG